MYGRFLAIAGRCRLVGSVLLLVLLFGAQAAWAGPFSEVPTGHWAYAACTRLVEIGWLPAERPTGFSGEPQLTRFEFGVAILAPLNDVDRVLAVLPEDADPKVLVNATARALSLGPSVPEDAVAAAASDLRRLAGEFDEVLSTLSFDASRALRGLQTLDEPAVRQWRKEALSAPMAAMGLVAARPADDAFRVPFAHGTVALTYNRDLDPPDLLDYLAASSAAERAASADAGGTAEPALRDPLVSRLRTAYEYGLGSALTLSLAYEEIARRGQGLAALDTTSLASFGIGYRLTPSTSVKLSYSLLEYSNHVYDSPPLRDRMAETAVSIEF